MMLIPVQKNPVLRWLLIAAMLLSASAVHAGLFDDEEARLAILDLRQQVQAVRLSVEAVRAEGAVAAARAAEESAVLRRSVLELQNQIETLRAELAKLRGQNEQLSRDVADLQRRQKDIAQGVDERLRQFEPVKVSVDGRDFMADPAEKRDYEAALQVFRKGDFPAAQALWVDFLNRYGPSAYGPSALFWLGNARYATREYKEAIVSFRALLTRAPEHLRAAESMLSIANCQTELKDNKAAKKTLEDLIKAFPQSEAALAAKERLLRLK